MRTGGSRRPVAAVIAGVLALGLVACGGKSPGGTGGSTSPGSVDGLPVTHFSSGLKADAPKPQLQVRNVADDESDRVATATIADVEAYWSQQLPADFGMQFQPVKTLLSYDSNGPNQQSGCGDTKKLINAFYCGKDDSVSWDRGVLLPAMIDQFGQLSVVTVLAHEFGHAVQFRLMDKAGITRNTPTIVTEQQADCFAGGYFRWVAEGKSKYFNVSTSEGLNAALSSLFLVRDTAGESALGKDSHGTAFDRLFAFQAGFEKGPKECAGFRLENIKPRLTERAFDKDDKKENANAGDMAIDNKAIGYLQKSLDSAFQPAGVAGPKIVAQGGSCQGGPATPPASYCPSSNTVTVDLQALAALGRPVDQQGEFSGQSKGGHGDFAAFAEIASRYALGIQKAKGASIDNTNAGLRTACLVGAWAAVTATTTEQGAMRLSAGDLDEAISDLLRPDSLVASDVNGKRVDAGFSRVEAMRVGYL
ncbi:aminopeptidase, partial [Amycolatopsis rhizosphaerae]